MNTSIMIMSSLTLYTLIYMGLVYSMQKFSGLSREPSTVKDSSANGRQYVYGRLQEYRANVNADTMNGYQKAA